MMSSQYTPSFSLRQLFLIAAVVIALLAIDVTPICEPFILGVSRFGEACL